MMTAPFIKTHDTVSKIMADVVFALLPACFMAWLVFGMAPVLVILVACGSAIAAEFLFSRIYWGHTDGLSDGSSIVTGVLLACTLAPFTPLYCVAFGSATAIIFGKLLPGGLGRNWFNPALVGREFMTIFFPAIMTSGTIWYQAQSVNITKLNWLSDTFFDTLLLKGNGAIGEYSIVLLISGGIFLLLRRRISWHIPFALTATFISFFLILSPDGAYQFSMGGVILGAVYMATDMPTSSTSSIGKLYYGAMIGATACAFIALGAKYEYMSYAILLLNAFAVPIDWIFRPRTWGNQMHWVQRAVRGIGLTIVIGGCTYGIAWLHQNEMIMYLVFAYIIWSIVYFIVQQYRRTPKTAK